MPLPELLIQQIENATGSAIQLHNSQAASGGCINQSFTLSTSQGRFFVKFNDARRLDMFEAEAAGLQELASAQAIKIPQVIATGSDSRQSWLILQHIEFSRAQANSEVQAGRQLAQMHQQIAQQHGWRRNNTIGSTAQINQQESDWVAFWKRHRLGYQLGVAVASGYRGTVIEKTERLIDDCDSLIDHQPAASLLHGDLWSGNLAYDNRGDPVIFDPATYYGDAETDLAMTELFGGFSGAFYQAYAEVRPIDSGYQVRRQLYNLYHILNHMNIFGGGYESQAAAMAERLLNEAG